MFDYTQTGAKPKTKPILTHPTKSSLSSSTSSSLSSLSIISQNSYAPSSNSNAFGKRPISLKNKSRAQNLPQDSNPDISQANNEEINEVLNISVDSFSDKKDDANTKLVMGFATTPCPLCFKAITGSLQEHFQREHQEHECGFCGLLFDSDYILNQHMITMHADESKNVPRSDDIEKRSSSDELVCPICMIVVKEGK